MNFSKEEHIWLEIYKSAISHGHLTHESKDLANDAVRQYTKSFDFCGNDRIKK
jgi:hypothetical protein